MPMPMGMDKWFPTLLTALPGMESVMTSMMKKKMASKGVASLERAARTLPGGRGPPDCLPDDRRPFDMDPAAFTTVWNLPVRRVLRVRRPVGYLSVYLNRFAADALKNPRQKAGFLLMDPVRIIESYCAPTVADQQMRRHR